MQALIVIAIMIIMGFFGYMESNRNDIAAFGKIDAFKADNVSGNIMQYNDMLTKYALANYDALHENDYTNFNNVGHVTLLDYTKNSISDYSKRNLNLFLNYTSSTFNYGEYSLSNESSPQMAKLYLVTSFNDYNSGLNGYKNTSLDHVMGTLADKYSNHLYQGNSVSWIVPILLKKDDACNVIEIFSQVPNDSNDMKQMDKIKTLFNRFCVQLQSQGYVMKTYVYIASIIPHED